MSDLRCPWKLVEVDGESAKVGSGARGLGSSHQLTPPNLCWQKAGTLLDQLLKSGRREDRFAFVVGPSTNCTEQSRQVVLDVAGEVCSARHQPELQPLLAQHGHGLPGPSLQFMLTAMVVELGRRPQGETRAVCGRGMFSPAAVYEVCMRMNTCCMEAAAWQQPRGGDSGGAGASGGGEDARGDGDGDVAQTTGNNVPISEEIYRMYETRLAIMKRWEVSALGLHVVPASDVLGQMDKSKKMLTREAIEIAQAGF
ncbi:hypothetical protein PLESTF_000010500 [Pleodorina starrii]|nr:hypothetical protein PLESTF_000010500 [Pleodorina starrii]